MAEPDDDYFSRWGVGGGEKPKPAPQGKRVAPTVAAAPPAAMDQFSNWKLGRSAPRVLVETPDGLIDRATGAKVPAAEASPDEILQRVLPQTLGEKLSGSARATIHGAVNAVPIAGPSLVNLGNTMAATALEKTDGIPKAEAMRRIQEMQAQDARNNPVSDFAGTMAGAAGSIGMAANTIPGAARALGIVGPSMRARMLAGGASGAALAAPDAMVRGHDPLLGAAFGAAGGAAGPPVGALIGAGANKLVNAAQYVMPTGVTGLSKPGANLLGQIVAGEEPAAVQASLARLGPQAMMMDAGPGLTNIGGGLATKPGEAQSIAMNALRERAAAANSRLAGDLNASIGNAPVPSRISGNIENAQAALSPQYNAVLEQARAVNTTPLANELDASLANLRGPAQEAVRRVRGYLNIPGTKELDPHPRALLSSRQAIDGLLANEKNPQVVRQLTMSRQRIDAELARSVPGIKEVDAQFQELARQNAGLTLGGRVLDSGKTAIHPQEMRQQFQEAAIPAGTMVGPSATPLRIQEGARAEIDRLVGTKANDLVALRQALQGEGGWNTDKLSTIFGPERANRLLGAVNREAQFADTTQTITRNSETARRVSANKLLEEADPASTNLTGASLGGLALQTARNAIINPMMKMIMQSNNEPMKVELAKIMTLQGPARDQALSQLYAFMNRQAVMNSVGSGTNRFASQGANSLLLSAPVAGRQVEAR